MSATTIRPCGAADLPALFSIVNDAAQVLSRPETERLLRKYWSIPERQIETSVVLSSRNRTRPVPLR